MARLKGKVHDVRGARFLEVFEQIPAGKQDWQPVGQGSWMPFDGGPHNGGQWLHDPDVWAKGRGAAGQDDACRRY